MGVIRDRSPMLVPRPWAVLGMNWISPVACVSGFATLGRKVPLVSKLITPMRSSGLAPTRWATPST